MWFDCTKTAFKKLKVAYNNSSRRFMIILYTVLSMYEINDIYYHGAIVLVKCSQI